MRYSYEKKCPVLFVSITVSGVIWLNSVGPFTSIYSSANSSLSPLIYQLHSLILSFNPLATICLFLCIKPSFSFFSHHYPSFTPSPFLCPLTLPLSSFRFLCLLCSLYFLCPPFATTSILSTSPPLLPPPSFSPLFLYVTIHNVSLISLLSSLSPHLPSQRSLPLCVPLSSCLPYSFTLWVKWTAKQLVPPDHVTGEPGDGNGSSKRLWGRSITAIKVNKEKHWITHTHIIKHTLVHWYTCTCALGCRRKLF